MFYILCFFVRYFEIILPFNFKPLQVYPNTEPLSFLVAFYGCLLAGVIPVPVEVPLTKRVRFTLLSHKECFHNGCSAFCSYADSLADGSAFTCYYFHNSLVS